MCLVSPQEVASLQRLHKPLVHLICFTPSPPTSKPTKISVRYNRIQGRSTNGNIGANLSFRHFIEQLAYSEFNTSAAGSTKGKCDGMIGISEGSDMLVEVEPLMANREE